MYVAPVSFGLGDLVVSLPAIQALIARGRHDGVETWLIARSDAQASLTDRIAGLSGWVDEESFDREDHDGMFFDLRDHPLQSDWWWGSAEFEDAFGALTINDILGRICADFGIPADFTRPIPLTAFPRPELRSSVLLVTETDGASKQWSAERWRSVANGLRARGLAMRLVTRDEPAAEMRALGIPAARASSPGDAPPSSATDTSHEVPPMSRQTAFSAPAARATDAAPTAPPAGPERTVQDPCDAACMAAEKEYAHNARVDLRGFRWQPRLCPVGGRCLDAVQPEEVLAALDDVLRCDSRTAQR